MISICIPVYNICVLPLVKSLLDLIEANENEVEIIIADDASELRFKEKNEALNSMPLVNYYQLDNNIGRSSIRNFLAKKANQPFLLFIDADSEIPDSAFLSRYREAIKSSKVICGGTSYAAKPSDEKLLLRYVFGINREVRDVEDRILFPYRSFSAHNFCIDRDLFLSHQFDEQIKSYGHEDTLLGFALKKDGVMISHINNPLIHIGLEPSMEFIEKTNTGLENLILLVKKNPQLNEMAEEVKVLRYYFKLKKLGLIHIASAFFKTIKGRLLKNLLSSDPSLFYFDLYKLGYLCNRAKNL